MLPIHPLLSEENALYDPHKQWALVCDTLTAPDRSALEHVFRLALRGHTGQWRNTAANAPPVPYIVHPVRVARILAVEWNMRGREAVAAALLHDVLEDSPVNKQAELADEIRRLAGDQVLRAVDTLTKPRLPQPVPEETKARRAAEYFNALRAAPNWVRMVKCADRVDNLRDAVVWGDRSFWRKYSSETIGWHLVLARETAPIAEVALFKALVDGERTLNGRVPVWADGHLIDPAAAQLIPEHIALNYRVMGLARRDDTLIVGMAPPVKEAVGAILRQALNSDGKHIGEIEFIPISSESLDDAFAAGLYGRFDAK